MDQQRHAISGHPLPYEEAVKKSRINDVMNNVKHPDDAAVDRMAALMKERLKLKREQGRGGWNDPKQCKIEILYARLLRALDEDKMVDVANFAMMIHIRKMELSKDKPWDN